MLLRCSNGCRRLIFETCRKDVSNAVFDQDSVRAANFDLTAPTILRLGIDIHRKYPACASCTVHCSVNDITYREISYYNPSPVVATCHAGLYRISSDEDTHCLAMPQFDAALPAFEPPVSGTHGNRQFLQMSSTVRTYQHCQVAHL